MSLPFLRAFALPRSICACMIFPSSGSVSVSARLQRAARLRSCSRVLTAAPTIRPDTLALCFSPLGLRYKRTNVFSTTHTRTMVQKPEDKITSAISVTRTSCTVHGCNTRRYACERNGVGARAYRALCTAPCSGCAQTALASASSAPRFALTELLSHFSARIPYYGVLSTATTRRSFVCYTPITSYPVYAPPSDSSWASAFYLLFLCVSKAYKA